MTVTALKLLPRQPTGSVATRTAADRLQLVSALIAAPSFDPVFRHDVIEVPGDHPTYGWLCGVAGCQRPKVPAHDFCRTHAADWGQAKNAGHGLADFLRASKPLRPAEWNHPGGCRLCPHLPIRSRIGLCFLHSERWQQFCKGGGHAANAAKFEPWLAGQPAFPSFGPCVVVACPEVADHPVGLCTPHRKRYKEQGSPGGVRMASGWSHRIDSYDDRDVVMDDIAAFQRWCAEATPMCRMDGKVSLLGLQPLVKAEIKWTMWHHTRGTEGAQWPFPWIQYLADLCRQRRIAALADVDLAEVRPYTRLIAKTMVDYLRLIYFTRQDTKDAGFIETDHYGIGYLGRSGFIDLSKISQRWLRDLLWHHIDSRLSSTPPRSRSPFDQARRGCIELSAHLQDQAPAGGHDPAALTAEHMLDFVADQRHRVQHELPPRGSNIPNPGPLTRYMMGRIFDSARSVLREAMEIGAIDSIGLPRAFVVALPPGGNNSGRRRPFSDAMARALASAENLAQLQELDPDDHGLRDIWEALVLTGRRVGEVLNVRLECVDRYNNLPMFWHDQTKVNNLDQAIRIPERLYQRIEQRQHKTIAKFVQRNGRPPTPQERLKLALFPKRRTNRDGVKGVSTSWFHTLFRAWVMQIDIGHAVPHQARHTLATNLLRNGATLAHVKRYLGHLSIRMAEHYVHLANTDPALEDALNAVWVGGPGSAQPGQLLSTGTPMTRDEAEALALDLTRRSTPAEGGLCTFQPVVNGDACPWNLDCHNCEQFVMSGADLVYWHRKREQWHTLAERATDPATANFLHDTFEPTARAIDGLEQALAAVGLLDDALALDLRRPQDYFGRIWALAFRAQDLAAHQQASTAELEWA